VIANYHAELTRHCERTWGACVRDIRPSRPRNQLEDAFRVLVFQHRKSKLWIYATCGIAREPAPALELHLFSPVDTDAHVELLSAVADYHRAVPLGLGHTVNIGRPWLPDSACTFGLISLPYVDGPAIEDFTAAACKCYWLVPITEAERDFKKANGLEVLEQRFQSAKLAYWRPDRKSVV
jgi:hypothetical protein